jgi:glucokinase
MLLLVGDIGGTKTILRLVDVNVTDKSFTSIAEANYISANFPDLVPMVRTFLSDYPGQIPPVACFAIAGPVINHTSHLTNLRWVLTAERLQIELGIDQVNLINDFAANSFGILGLQDNELHTLHSGERKPNSPIAVIGAGTGLGEGFLIPQDNHKYLVFASEGGHTDFAPRNQLEIQVLQYLQQKLNTDHISVERVVSGQGIVNLYQFLRDTNFDKESPTIGNRIREWEAETVKTIDPAAIIAIAALHHSDRLCVKALEMFIEAYGAETGNVALKLLPYGGIYIAGGIAAKILPFMEDNRFITAYKDKGRVSHLLESIPINIVLNPQIGLLGSVLYALQSLN